MVVATKNHPLGGNPNEDGRMNSVSSQKVQSQCAGSKIKLSPIEVGVHGTTSVKWCQHRLRRPPTAMHLCPASCMALIVPTELTGTSFHASRNSTLQTRFTTLATTKTTSCHTLLSPRNPTVTTRFVTCPFFSVAKRSFVARSQVLRCVRLDVIRFRAIWSQITDRLQTCPTLFLQHWG